MTLDEYFRANRYAAKYNIGDRVFGHYGKIPFVGTVGNDTLVNPDDGPRVSVHLDLPLKIDGVFRTVLFVKHKDIKPYK